MKKLIVLMFLFAALMVQASAPPIISPMRDSVVKQAETYIGVRERGVNEGVEINKFLASTGLSPGYAWCAAFVNYVYIQAGANHPAKSAAWSPTWFPANKVVYSQINSNDEAPQPGDVFGLYYTKKKRIAHVGMVLKWPLNDNIIYTIEGNTNDNGSREGDGVYKKRRLKRQIYQVANWIGFAHSFYKPPLLC